jgi:hypothetical protein
MLRRQSQVARLGIPFARYRISDDQTVREEVPMKVYMRKEANPLKWVLAAILFIAIMTFTLGEVNGYPTNSKPGSGSSSSDNDVVVNSSNSGGEGSNYKAPEQRTSVVPEPGTLLLMATGLGAVYIFRKSRKVDA